MPQRDGERGEAGVEHHAGEIEQEHHVLVVRGKVAGRYDDDDEVQKTPRIGTLSSKVFILLDDGREHHTW